MRNKEVKFIEIFTEERPVMKAFMTAPSKSSNGILIFMVALVSMIIGALGFYAFKRRSAMKFNNTYFDLLAAEQEI